jgi:hypothetical protein
MKWSDIWKSKEAVQKQSHVVVTDTDNPKYECMVHLWVGDSIQNGSIMGLTTQQAILLKDALVHRYGV